MVTVVVAIEMRVLKCSSPECVRGCVCVTYFLYCLPAVIIATTGHVHLFQKYSCCFFFPAENVAVFVCEYPCMCVCV